MIYMIYTLLVGKCFNVYYEFINGGFLDLWNSISKLNIRNENKVVRMLFFLILKNKMESNE